MIEPSTFGSRTLSLLSLLKRIHNLPAGFISDMSLPIHEKSTMYLALSQCVRSNCSSTLKSRYVQSGSGCFMDQSV